MLNPANNMLNREKWIKVAKGAGIAAAGAVLTYLLSIVPGMELGELTPIVVAVLSVLVNVVRQLSVK